MTAHNDTGPETERPAADAAGNNCAARPPLLCSAWILAYRLRREPCSYGALLARRGYWRAS